MFRTFLGKLAQNSIGFVKNNIPIIHKIEEEGKRI
jgi:hypothetical protein